MVAMHRISNMKFIFLALFLLLDFCYADTNNLFFITPIKGILSLDTYVKQESFESYNTGQYKADRYWAQVFTTDPGASYQPTRLSWYGRNYDLSEGTIQFYIVELDGGEPDLGADIAESTQFNTNTLSTSYGWINTNLTPSGSVSGSTQYAIVLRRYNVGTTSPYWQASSGTTDPYTGGDSYTSPLGTTGTWSTTQSGGYYYDQTFIIYSGGE